MCNYTGREEGTERRRRERCQGVTNRDRTDGEREDITREDSDNLKRCSLNIVFLDY